MIRIFSVLPLLFLMACTPDESLREDRPFQVIPLSRQDIVVTVSASGALEPLRSLEIKSKASGEILQMPVELGDDVKESSLLVRVDPRTVKNQVEQAEASLEVARMRLTIAERQKDRSKTLLEEGHVSEQSHESSLLEFASARSAEVSARTSLDQARERLEDTEIRAPMTGTVIARMVEAGQIISSATSQVTGGTTLLTMAKLDTLQVRAMVDETDIGKIRSGMQAEITVDAHPRELFSGTVIKVEPRAVTTQNVTTFPVLVRVLNDRDLLLPGMNVEVEIRTGSRENVLALPLEAIRSRRDYLVAAGTMGLDAEEATSLLEAEQAKSPMRGKPSISFLVRDGAPSPVPVGLGLANWDFAEILWGLEEGDSVAVTLSSGLLMQQDRWKNRMKSWSSMGSFKKGESSKGKKPEARNGSSARGKRPGSSKRPKGKAGGGH